MTLNIFCLVSLLASNFPAVLSVPQVSNQASNDTPNDEGSSTGAESLVSLITPGNTAYISGPNFQDSSNNLGLQDGNVLQTIHLTDNALAGAGLSDADPGGGTVYKLFSEADKDGIFNAVDPNANTPLLAQVQQSPENPSSTPSQNPGETSVVIDGKSPTANTLLLSQAQKLPENLFNTPSESPGEASGVVDANSPTANTLLLAQARQLRESPGETSGESSNQNIENTPSENAAGERAEKTRRKRPQNIPSILGNAPDRGGYYDSLCPNGARWACCIINKATGGFYCRWLTDGAVCRVRACCFPNSRGLPDEWCPDQPPQRKVLNVLHNIGDMFRPVLGPESGGSFGGAGAAGIGGAAGAGP